jgi:hypothetical protein
MCRRIAALVAFVASTVPAIADEMKADEARQFVIGKLFSYRCFEGTRGAGRIYTDGSVAGTIQVRGAGPVHYVRLPPNTLQVRGDSVCATVRGLPFSPCFTLDRTSQESFRGAVYGLGFAYCEFSKRGHRIELAHRPAQSVHEPAHKRPHEAEQQGDKQSAPQSTEPVPLRAAIDTP